MSRLACPKCGEEITVPTPAPEAVVCGACGARLRLNARRPASPSAGRVVTAAALPDDDGDEPRPRKKKKRAKADPPPRRRLPLWAVVAGPLALAVVVGVGGWLLLGRGGGAEAGGGDEGRGASRRGKPAVAAFVPDAWAVRPSVGVPLPAAVEVPGLLAVAGDRYAARIPDYQTREDVLTVGTLDRQTGRPAGAITTLLREQSPTVAAAPMMPQLPGAAQPGVPAVVARSPLMWVAPGPAGGAAATRQDGTLLIWTTGRPAPLEVKPPPGGPALSTVLLGWSAGGKVVRLTDAGLVGLDPVTGQELFRTPGQFGQPCTLAPGGTWVVARAGPPSESYLEVLDTATGRPLGRLGGEGRWQTVSVSPDGTGLVALRPETVTAYTDRDAVRTQELHAFDLATGKRTALIRYRKATVPRGGLGGPGERPRPQPAVGWLDDRRVAVEGAGVFDLDARVHLVSQYVTLAPVPPDPRAWAADPGTGKLSLLPPPAPAGDAVAFRPGDSVRLEVDCGTRAASASARATLADVLAEEEYAVGSGDWVVRFTLTVNDSSLVFDVPGGGTLVTPKAVGRLDLVAPDGSVVDSAVVESHWGDVQGRFRTKTESGLKKGMGTGTTITHYDFGRRGARGAMEDAEREDVLGKVEKLWWARAAARGPDGKFVLLPRSAGK